MQVRFLQSIFILLLCFPVSVPGQNASSVHGTIRDSLNNSIYFANIFAFDSSGILAFTYSDKRGYYQLDIPAYLDRVFITASLLGYRSDTTVLNLMEEKYDRHRLDFTLYPQVKLMEEIVVREKMPPIRGKSDTTIYHAAAFSDSTEYSVEELLKKVPGIYVSEDGAITVNGKTVSKVLVEGDDMMGGNYTILTRNVRAWMIDEVQVIDHYHENPVLKNILPSDEMVLNLSIKDEKKTLLSGSGTAGSGYGDDIKGFLHSNIFSFSKYAKSLLLTNWNNTGYAALSNIRTGSNVSGNNFQGLRNGILENTRLVQPLHFQDIGLPEKFVKANRTGLAAFNQIVNFSPQFKAKASGTVFLDRFHQQSTNRTNYLLGDENLELIESEERVNSDNHFSVAFQTDYFSANHGSSLRTLTKMNWQQPEYTQGLSRQFNRESTLPLEAEAQAGIRNFYSIAEYSLKTGDKAVTQFGMQYASTQVPEKLIATSGSYPVFFGVDSTHVRLQQNSYNQDRKLQPYLRYFFAGRTIDFQVEGGGVFQHFLINSDIQLQDSNTHDRIVLDAPFRNDQQNTFNEFYLKSFIKKYFAKFAVQGGLKTAWLSVENSGQLINNQTRQFLNIVPELQLRYEPSQDIDFTTGYRFSSGLPDDKRRIQHWYLTNYQSLQRGLNTLALIQRHRFYTGFRYRALSRVWFFNARIAINFSNNAWGNIFQFSPSLFTQMPLQPIQEKGLSLYFQSDHFLSPIDSRINLIFRYFRRNSENKINQSLRENTNSTYHFTLDYGTAFDGWFNTYLTNHFLLSAANSTIHDEAFGFKAIQWQPQWRNLLDISKNLKAELTVYWLYNKLSINEPEQFFTGEFNITYQLKLKGKQSQIKVSAVNLLDGKNYKRVSVTDFSQNLFSLQVVPRFIIATWDFSF